MIEKYIKRKVERIHVTCPLDKQEEIRKWFDAHGWQIVFGGHPPGKMPFMDLEKYSFIAEKELKDGSKR